MQLETMHAHPPHNTDDSLQADIIPTNTLHPNNSDCSTTAFLKSTKPDITLTKMWMSSCFPEELKCDYWDVSDFPTLEERKIVNVIKDNAENAGALNSLFFVNSTQPKLLNKIT